MTTAPIDPELLALALAPFGSSRLLPRAAYTDPAVLAWERDNFFGDWVCLGRSADIAAPGSQRAVGAGAFGVLLLRDTDGTLRGFVNACRHRGHELLPCGATANRKSVVCPYHAWSYDLAGDLRNAPGFRDAADFDPTQHSLQPLPVREWQGWVFAAPSGTAGDFAEHIGEAESIVAPYDPARLELVDSHDYVIEANWKVIVENYQECYHCSMIHPELCRVSPPQSGDNVVGAGDWVGGRMDLRPDAATMSMDGTSPSTMLATLSEQEQRTVMYLVMFPNLLLSLHPDYVMTHVLTPLTPGRTKVECSWLFPTAAVSSPGFDPSNAVDFWDLTNRQDWAACESVQRGISAPQWLPGPLAPDEDGVYDFVTLVANRYRGDRSGSLPR
jgi:Rieske 2Fe-2S family protein